MKFLAAFRLIWKCHDGEICLVVTVRKRSCGKVMFSEVCVKNSVHGGMHGGEACLAGGMCGGGCAWQGDMHGRGRGHVWWG